MDVDIKFCMGFGIVFVLFDIISVLSEKDP